MFPLIISIIYNFVGGYSLFFNIIFFCKLLNSFLTHLHTFSICRVWFWSKLSFRCYVMHEFRLDWFNLNFIWVIRFAFQAIICWLQVWGFIELILVDTVVSYFFIYFDLIFYFIVIPLIIDFSLIKLGEIRVIPLIFSFVISLNLKVFCNSRDYLQLI